MVDPRLIRPNKKKFLDSTFMKGGKVNALHMFAIQWPSNDQLHMFAQLSLLICLEKVANLIPNQDRVYRRFDSERLKQKARGSCEMPSDSDFADVKNDYPVVVVERT